MVRRSRIGPCTLAARSADLVSLLDSALRFHEKHGDGPCPVCGAAGILGAEWHAREKAHADELRSAAKAVSDAQVLVKTGRDALRSLSSPSGSVLAAASALGLPGKPVVDLAERVRAAASLDPERCAEQSESALPLLRDALVELKAQAAVELGRREDAWRPMASEVQAWLAIAREAQSATKRLPEISAAEKWLNGATDDLRNERFAPHVSEVKRIWNQLRHTSNVSLEDIRLLGAASSRRVQLDVAVDGTAGAAVGVMSQGVSQKLALVLFGDAARSGEVPARLGKERKVICLRESLREGDLASRLAHTWAALSRACHHHPYELPPTVEEIRRWMEPVRELHAVLVKG